MVGRVRGRRVRVCQMDGGREVCALQAMRAQWSLRQVIGFDGVKLLKQLVDAVDQFLMAKRVEQKCPGKFQEI